MAVPTIQDTTVTTDTTNNTSFTVNMPATRPDGQLYVAVVGKAKSGTFTAPGGWTLIREVAAGSRGVTGAWYRIGSSEPATYEWTFGTNSRKWGIIYRITGHDATTPIDVSAEATGGSSSAQAPAATTTVVDTLVIRACTVDIYEVTATPTTEDTKGVLGGGGNAAGYGASHENGPNPAGTTGTADFTNDTSTLDWGALTIAVAEDQGGGPSDVIKANRVDSISCGSYPVETAGLDGELMG